MKRNYLVLIAAVVALLMAACKGKKEEAPKSSDPLQPQMIVSEFDTTTVQNLTYDFLELLKQGQLDEAISRLYVLDGDQVKPLPDEQKPECYFSLGLHRVYDYRIIDYTFYKETDSEVQCEIIIEDPAQKENPGHMIRRFCPVRRNGAWYLTLPNTETDKQKSQIDSLRQVKRQM